MSLFSRRVLFLQWVVIVKWNTAINKWQHASKLPKIVMKFSWLRIYYTPRHIKWLKLLLHNHYMSFILSTKKSCMKPSSQFAHIGFLRQQVLTLLESHQSSLWKFHASKVPKIVMKFSCLRIYYYWFTAYLHSICKLIFTIQNHM